MVGAAAPSARFAATLRDAIDSASAPTVLPPVTTAANAGATSIAVDPLGGPGAAVASLRDGVTSAPVIDPAAQSNVVEHPSAKSGSVSPRVLGGAAHGGRPAVDEPANPSAAAANWGLGSIVSLQPVSAAEAEAEAGAAAVTDAVSDGVSGAAPVISVPAPDTNAAPPGPSPVPTDGGADKSTLPPTLIAAPAADPPAASVTDVRGCESDGDALNGADATTPPVGSGSVGSALVTRTPPARIAAAAQSGDKLFRRSASVSLAPPTRGLPPMQDPAAAASGVDQRRKSPPAPDGTPDSTTVAPPDCAPDSTPDSTIDPPPIPLADAQPGSVPRNGTLSVTATPPAAAAKTAATVATDPADGTTTSAHGFAAPTSPADHTAITPSHPIAEPPAATRPLPNDAALPASGTPAPTATPKTSLPATDVARQLAAAVTASGGERLVVRLNPASLGAVQIEVVDVAVGSVRVLVEQPATLQLLAGDLPSLQRALGDAGFVVTAHAITLQLAPTDGAADLTAASFDASPATGAQLASLASPDAQPSPNAQPSPPLSSLPAPSSPPALSASSSSSAHNPSSTDASTGDGGQGPSSGGQGFGQGFGQGWGQSSGQPSGGFRQQPWRNAANAKSTARTAPAAGLDITT